MARVDRLATFLVLAFPIVLLAVKPLAIVLFAFLVVVGIFISVKYGKNPFIIESIKIFSWLTVGYFAVMVFSVVLSSEPTNSWTHLSRISYFLVAPFVALAVAQASVSIEELAKSFKIGVVVAGVISIAGFISSDGVGRFSGMYNANTFGDLAVLMLFFSIINIKNEDSRTYLFTLVSIFFGATAISMSGSRGSIIAVVFLSISFIYVMYRYSNTNHKRVWTAIIFTVSILGLSTSFLHTTSSRLSSIKTDIKKWESSGEASSVGQRLEMYSSGWKAFLDSPVIGYGYHNCGIATSRYASQDAQMQKGFKGRWHLHNEIMTTMVNAGAIGLIWLLSLYILPLMFFVKRLRSNIYSVAGVMLISGYILLGVTHTLFGYEYETAFFIIFLAYTMHGSQIGSKQI